jgi:1-acyl-sn-glycerol-3-phosphate acyltransferase
MGTFYRALRGTLRLALRGYFRDIEVHGGEHVPPDGPCVMVANHHNSLIDPYLLVVASPRPLAFIAKAPLFRMPVLGRLLRWMHCIPAHRSQDPGYAKEKNQQLYEQAAKHLATSPAALGIFPEGKSHSDPQLAEFKHGASRIAFEAEAVRGGVRVQLVSLHFEKTRGFRGKVLVQFGPALTLEAHRERYAADPRAAVAAFTEELHAKLSEMILSAESHELLALADLVGRMGVLDAAGDEGALKAVFDRKKRLLEAYKELRVQAPEDVEALRVDLARYRRMLDLLGVRDEHVAEDYRPMRVIGYALGRTLVLALGLPFVAAGIALNFVPYLISWAVSRLFPRLPDRMATAGFVTALGTFPLFWAGLAWAAFRRAGLPAAAGVLAAAPLTGLAALRWMDAWHRVLIETAGLWAAVALPAARAALKRTRARVLARVRRLVDLRRSAGAANA